MRDNKQNINFYVQVNYQDQEQQLLVSFSSTVKQLRQIIITYFKLNQSKYDIYYKNLKLNNNDNRPLSLLFEKDKKPILYILDNKKDILPKSKQKTSLTLYTKMPEIKLNEIITKFFKYKQLENDADIKHNIKDMYVINFSKPSLCSDFQEFYDNYLRLEEESKDPPSPPKFKTANTVRCKLILPKINVNYNMHKNKGEESNKTNNYNYNFNNNKIVGFYDRKEAINKVILNNSKSDKISKKCIRSGKYRFHNSGKKENSKKSMSMRNKYNNYKGVYKQPYMNVEERYYRDKYLDKKNWLNKNGFLPCVNKRNSDNFISNYVNATPSESPLLFHFRDVSKNKWINPKGFH